MASFPTNSSRRIVIVGGGVSGLSIAVRLSQSGLPVTLLEASDLGRAASSKNQGWLYSGAWFAPRQRNLASLCYESLQETLRFCPECLEPGTGAMIYVLSSPKTNPLDWTDAWTAAGIPYEVIPIDVAVEETGIPEPVVKHAFRLPDRAIRPTVLLERLTTQAEYQGVDIRTESLVTSLLKRGDQVHGVITARREEIDAGLVILAANVGELALWPNGLNLKGPKAGLQTEFTRVGLKTHCLTIRPFLATTPFCVVDMEGLNHIPHQPASVFGTSRWIPVVDGRDQQPLEPEIDRLRGLVTDLYPRLRFEEHDVLGWAGTTVQAMHFDQVEPGLAPMPTVIDHFYEPPFVSNLLSVFPGRGSLWPQLAEATRCAVLEKLREKVSDMAKPPWAIDSPNERSREA
jgi:glycine/D-amino acid oxidase-like deaminating enzyme